MEILPDEFAEASAPTRTALLVHNLSVAFRESPIISGVAIKIPQHKVLAIVGPSGCGKSTFLRCLNRMHDDVPGMRVSGEISFDGGEQILDADPVAVRRRIGMVFQKPNPFPKSIFDNVAFGVRLQGVKRKAQVAERVEEALQLADIFGEVKDRLRDSALTLSGGQQQRLCIARALAVHPEVLLMDEPTSALDPRSTARIEVLLSTLKSRVTVLMVTHNLAQAQRCSDYLAFFLNGKLIEWGQTAQVFSRAEREETSGYLSGKFG